MANRVDLGCAQVLALVQNVASLTPGIVDPCTSALVANSVDLGCAQVLKQGWPW